MSTISDEASRCKREVDDAYQKRDKLRGELADQKAELTRRQLAHQDTTEISRKLFLTENSIDEQDARLEKASREFDMAMSNLAAEKKLENELHQQLNKDNDPKLGKDVGKILDNFGKKKDELEL